MTSETQILSEELEKLLKVTEQELLNTFKNLSGSLKDIGNGTRIKIPTVAGYVSCFKSEDSLEIALWFKDNLLTGTDMTQTTIDRAIQSVEMKQTELNTT